MMSGDELAARLLLASLPGVGPARATWLLSGGSAVDAVAHLRAGRLPPEMGRAPAGVSSRLVSRWATEARRLDGSDLLSGIRSAGMDVIGPDDAGWPFADDPEPPMLIFSRGNAGLLGRRPAVAVVGTRRCTSVGREVAVQLGQGLAEAGVVVVSGLASGIDAAAHQGALAVGGGVVAVVGTGLDVVYPKSNRRLWARVAAEGLLISEAAPGAKPERWRFPARNRLIAGMVDAVVVVESHAAGGSLLTVGEAADRGVAVMAVPGSVVSPASAGTNQLLLEGCPPVCSTADILDGIGVVGPGSTDSLRDQGEEPPATPGHDRAERDELSALGAAVLADVSAGAVHVDQLVGSCREPIPRVLAELQHLEALGLIELDGSTVTRPTLR